MKLRGIIAGAIAFVLSASLAFAQTNQGSSPLTGSKGGTNNAFMQFTGPSSSIKTFTLPNQTDTISTLNAIQTYTAAKTFNSIAILAGSGAFTTGLSLTTNQNASTTIGITNTSAGASALTGLSNSNGTGGAGFGLGGTGHSAVSALMANRAFINADAASAGIVLVTLSTDPILFAINSAEAGRFNGTTGALELATPLGLPYGGFGIAAGTSGGVPCFSSTTTVASSALLTQYGVLYGGGAGVCPTATAAMTNGQLLVGQTAVAPLPKTVSGDITIDANGVTAIGTAKVTFAMIGNVGALSVVGRSVNTDGVAGAITAAADYNILRRSGTAIGFGAIDLSQSGAVGTSLLALANGGCNAALTASNGGMLWSNASQCQILAGTANASRPLLSGSSAAPSWAAFSLPGSVTSGGVAYFSSTSAMDSSGLLAANGVMYGGGAGVAPGTATAGTNGQLLLGVTGSPPAMASMSQDCIISNAGVITCTKTNNVAFGTAATKNTGTSGNNIPLLDGNNAHSGTQDFQAPIKLSSFVTATQIAANTNNFTATDGSSTCSTKQTLRISSDASRNVTGFSCGQAEGDIRLVHNVGSFDVVLKNEDALSTAGNRMLFGGDVTLVANYSITLRYDGVASRWRAITTASAGGGGGGTVTSAATAAGNGIAVSGTCTITTTGTCTVAADASFFQNYKSGLTLSTAGSSSSFGISVGVATDSTNAAFMKLASAYTKSTSAWAVGTGQGALDTGTIANSTWYHAWIIQRPDTGVVDVLVSTSATAPTMPTNYTLKRRIGSMKTEGTAQWVKFKQTGTIFLWDVSVNDVAAGSLGTTAASVTLTTPPGVRTRAIMNAAISNATAGHGMLVSSLDISDQVVSGGNMNVGFVQVTNQYAVTHIEENTNTSNQVRARASAASSTYYIWTVGWHDISIADGL